MTLSMRQGSKPRWRGQFPYFAPRYGVSRGGLPSKTRREQDRIYPEKRHAPRYRVRTQNRPLAPLHLPLIAAGCLACHPPFSGRGLIVLPLLTWMQREARLAPP